MTRAPRPSITSPTELRASGMDDMRAIARKASLSPGSVCRPADAVVSMGSSFGATVLAPPDLAPARVPSTARTAALSFALGVLVTAMSASALARMGLGPVLAPVATREARPEPEPTRPPLPAEPRTVAPALPVEPVPETPPAAEEEEGGAFASSSAHRPRPGRVPDRARARAAARKDAVESDSASASEGPGAPTELQSLIDRALGRSGEDPAPIDAGLALPLLPTRSEVSSALRAVEDRVLACGDGAHGIATVRVVVEGSSGRVTYATATGDFAGTQVGSCIARAVRQASFPAFEKERFEVVFPYRL